MCNIFNITVQTFWKVSFMHANRFLICTGTVCLSSHLTWGSRGPVGAAGGQAAPVVAPLQGWASQRPGFGRHTASGSHCCGWEGQVGAKCSLMNPKHRPPLSSPASLSVVPPLLTRSRSLPLSPAVGPDLQQQQQQQRRAATWRSCTWTRLEAGWCQSSLGGQWCSHRRRRLRKSGCWPETQEEKIVTVMDLITWKRQHQHLLTSLYQNETVYVIAAARRFVRIACAQVGWWLM